MVRCFLFNAGVAILIVKIGLFVFFVLRVQIVFQKQKFNNLFFFSPEIIIGPCNTWRLGVVSRRVRTSACVSPCLTNGLGERL